MPRRFVERISTSKAYASGIATPLELSPRPYVVTSMLLDFDFNITTAATPGTTQDAYYRCLSSLMLVGDAGRNYVAIGDLRPVHFENKVFLPNGSKYVAKAVPGASQTGVTRKAQIRLHFGSRPVSPDGTYNPFDLTAGIPAGQSQLTLIPTWAPATNLGSGWTLNAGTQLSVTLYGVQAKAGEAPIVPAALPLLTTNAFIPPSASGSQGIPYQVPQSHFWHSSVMLSLAGAAPSDNRSSTALTDVGVRIPKDGNARIAKWAWDSFEVDTGKASGICEDDGTTFGTPVVTASVDAGVGRIDLTTIGGAVNQLYGLDMRGFDPGDIVIDMGVATVGTVLFLHRFYDLNG
jgi:hypothetical protein